MFAHLKKITNTRSVKNKNEKYYSNYLGIKEKNKAYVHESLIKKNNKVENHPRIFMEAKTTINDIVFVDGNFTSQETTKLQGVDEKNVFVGDQPNGKECYFVLDDVTITIVGKDKVNGVLVNNTIHDLMNKTKDIGPRTDDKKAVEEVVRMMNEQLHNKNIDAVFDNEIVTKEVFVSKITNNWDNIMNDKNKD